MAAGLTSKLRGWEDVIALSWCSSRGAEDSAASPGGLPFAGNCTSGRRNREIYLPAWVRSKDI